MSPPIRALELLCGAALRVFVIRGSDTGELAGLRGEGGFSAELGQHATINDYWFE